MKNFYIILYRYFNGFSLRIHFIILPFLLGIGGNLSKFIFGILGIKHKNDDYFYTLTIGITLVLFISYIIWTKRIEKKIAPLAHDEDTLMSAILIMSINFIVVFGLGVLLGFQFHFWSS